jgi:colanic acid biosynthesis glycosyl transferase WcaI
MQIELVTTNYSPEPTGIALYTTDLAQMLCESPVDCKVLTSLPHYPWWRVPEEFSDQVEGVHFINGVKVFRANHSVPSTFSAASRAKFEWSLYKNLKRVSNSIDKPDLILAFIPTVAALYVALAVKDRSGVPLGVIVQDLSGKGATQSGQTGGALVGLIAEWIELRALKKTDAIVVVSESMKLALVNSGIPDTKITLIPNYSVKNLKPLDKKIARKRLGWPESEFFAVHTGNMGAKQDLGNLVEAAKRLPAGMSFKIIGHGNQENKLKNMAAGVSAVDILPAVSDEDYPWVLAAADVLLVNERSSQLDMSLPSKLTSYLFSGRPVLAAVPSGGATAKYLSGIAEIVPAGSPLEVVHALIELRKDATKREMLAQKGITFAQENLSAAAGRAKYLEWVRKLQEIK